MSILDCEVSCFANYNTADNPKPVKLIKWLKSDQYREYIQALRLMPDKESRDKMKSTLPAITPSGLFSYRSGKDLIKHSGFIQIDIDGISDLESVKNQIIQVSQVAYLGLSVSGTGLWGLIPIKYPDKHKEHFKLLSEGFKNMGISLDQSCSDVTRLRGISYDPNAYFNENAEVLEAYYVAPKPKKKLKKVKSTGEDVTPLDDFDQRNDIIEILKGYGWTHHHNDQWTRPGKSSGNSGTYYKDSNGFWSFTSETPLPPNVRLSPSSVVCYYEHDGDYSAAAKSLFKLGYGKLP